MEKPGLPQGRAFEARSAPETPGIAGGARVTKTCVDVNAMFIRVAEYMDKILRGAKPGDLPVEQPTKLRLIVNLGTAKALGSPMPAPETNDHVYKILELVGSSEKSIEDVIQNAITRASKTIREMKWFEVVQTRGHIENGSVRHYQVTLRVGFTLEG
jgi:flavin-binding protein dodecin